jgi:3-keto steroid reductase
MIAQASTLYVLVTGANGGVGYATCTRLISSFLTSQPSGNLHLIPTTRNTTRGTETKNLLLQYVHDLSTSRKPFYKFTRGGTAASLSTKQVDAAKKGFEARIIVSPLVIDLCSLRSIHDAAETVKSLVPRVDVLICNAGIGGWIGMSWTGFFKQIWEEGPLAAVGRPNYKICRVGAVTKTQLVVIQNPSSANGTAKVPASETADAEPKLGEVFCANTFGHYVFAHQILNLLKRKDEEEKARVIWVSTLEAFGKYFDADDLQGLTSSNAYERSKRLTDLLALSYDSPVAKPFTASFLGDDATTTSSSPTSSRAMRSKAAVPQTASSPSKPPRMLLSHPGICVTPIMPLSSSILVWLEIVVFLFVRMLGSAWHTIEADKGAVSSVWLALEDEKVLDASEADAKKWGSVAHRWGAEGIQETPVEELGTVGFEKEGARCWELMEKLRLEWSKLMDNR